MQGPHSLRQHRRTEPPCELRELCLETRPEAGGVAAVMASAALVAAAWRDGVARGERGERDLGDLDEPRGEAWEPLGDTEGGEISDILWPPEFCKEDLSPSM